MTRLARSSDVLLIAAPALAIALFAAPASAQRAVAFFRGASSGVVPGGATLRGYEGWHDVTLVRHEIVSPRDPASGLPTGRRQHGPLRLRLPESVGSVTFDAMLARNENLPTVQVVMLSADGTTRYTIDLRNASISRVRTAWSPTDGAVYEIELTYESITWTHEPGGVTATDDWSSPVAP
jgi:type VI secretion system secreted protein Hcp